MLYLVAVPCVYNRTPCTPVLPNFVWNVARPAEGTSHLQQYIHSLLCSAITHNLPSHHKERSTGTSKNMRCVKEILELEETLFNCDDQGIQLYRNLLIVLVDTFVLNTVFKTL